MFTHTGPRRGDVFAESAFAKQIAEIEAGRRANPMTVGNLDSVRTFADVRDAVRAYWLLLEKCTPGEVYNIGGNRTMTVGDMLDILKALATVPIEHVVDPALLRPSDVTLQIPDTSKFVAATGLEARDPAGDDPAGPARLAPSPRRSGRRRVIISRTPFRISFFGGGTDYPAWYLKEGGAVLSTTIDKYCYISVPPPAAVLRVRVTASCGRTSRTSSSDRRDPAPGRARGAALPRLRRRDRASRSTTRATCRRARASARARPSRSASSRR